MLDYVFLGIAILGLVVMVVGLWLRISDLEKSVILLKETVNCLSEIIISEN